VTRRVSGDPTSPARSRTVSISAAALRNGDGSFRYSNQPVSFFPQWASSLTGAYRGWLVAGDFDDDGKSDLALTGGKGWSTLPVALSKGDGTFQVSNDPFDTFPGLAAQGDPVVLSGSSGGLASPARCAEAMEHVNIRNTPRYNDLVFRLTSPSSVPWGWKSWGPSLHAQSTLPPGGGPDDAASHFTGPPYAIDPSPPTGCRSTPAASTRRAHH